VAIVHVAEHVDMMLAVVADAPLHVSVSGC